MLWALSDAAWRFVLLIALGVAPYAVPVEAAPATGALSASVHLAVFVLLAGALALVVRIGWRANRWLGALAVATLALALLLPLVLRGDAGPLGRGMWVLAPFEWGTLAVLAAHQAARSLAPRLGGARRARLVAGAVVVAVGVASVLGARPRMRADRLWAEALAAAPASEAAALNVARAKDAAHDRKGAFAVLDTCVAKGGACRCGEGAASEALDLGTLRVAQTELDATSRACPKTSARLGLEAETLLMNGSTGEAVRVAQAALVLDAADPHASYALAYEAFARGDLATARDYAGKAIADGRGLPAQLLLGLMLFRQGDLDGARNVFQHGRELDPTSAKVLFNLALIDDRQGRYRDAREGYLAAADAGEKAGDLSVVADARVNLVYLTLSRGVVSEAQHHLDVLRQKAPDDPRITQLQAMIQAHAQTPK